MARVVASVLGPSAMLLVDISREVGR